MDIKLKVIIFILMFILASSGLLYGDSGHVTNEKCPILTDEDVDSNIFTIHDGKKVYFCCNSCKRKFIANPGYYLANLPQFSTGESTGHVETKKLDAISPSETEEFHDHETGHGDPGEVNKTVRLIGKFHPVVIHFPIALIMLAGLSELLFILTGKTLFSSTSRVSIFLGALGAAVAVTLGWAASVYAQYPGETGKVLTIHKWLGTSTGILIIIGAIFSELWYRNEKNYNRLIYRIILLLGVILVGLTGHFGAALVFGVDYFTW